MTWKNNTLENLKLARSIARELASIVALGQQKYIGQVEQGYGNYDHMQEEDGAGGVKNKAEALFRENYPRLQELKTKYIPRTSSTNGSLSLRVLVRKSHVQSSSWSAAVAEQALATQKDVQWGEFTSNL